MPVPYRDHYVLLDDFVFQRSRGVGNKLSGILHILGGFFCMYLMGRDINIVACFITLCLI